jgi:hypothetical protein
MPEEIVAEAVAAEATGVAESTAAAKATVETSPEADA